MPVTRIQSIIPITRYVMAGLLLLALSLVTGCEQTVVADNPLMFKFAKRIQTLVKDQDARAMDDVAYDIENAVGEEQLTMKEANRLIDVIVFAEAYDWAAANKSVMELINSAAE